MAPMRTTPLELRDLDWIRGALQTAVALEHSTMPLYCAAMYSLEVQNYPSYNIIRSVLMEEMVHMATAANMVAALGGSPQIRGLNPVYTGTGLPGGVSPDLPVVLAQLSHPQLENFMRLEAPGFMLPEWRRRVPYPTIGAFYDAIREAIERHPAQIRAAVAAGGPANQVGGNLGYPTFERDDPTDAVERFLAALDIITEQGEGAGGDTIGAGEAFQREGSHYARFAELRYGRRYLPPAATETRDPGAASGTAPGIVDRRFSSGGPADRGFGGGTEPEPSYEPRIDPDNEEEFFRGEPIDWPVVINTLAVPADGYEAILALDPNAAEVRKELEGFDDAYTQMMWALDDAWNGPAETWWPSLGAAVTQMDQMRVRSCFNIMRHQVPERAIARLGELYPSERKVLAEYTDLDRPVFYGPRFRTPAG
jgi:hypothetical protein